MISPFPLSRGLSAEIRWHPFIRLWVRSTICGCDCIKAAAAVLTLVPLRSNHVGLYSEEISRGGEGLGKPCVGSDVRVRITRLTFVFPL